MSEHGGLLGALFEAGEIHDETGCTVDESFEIQSHLAARRLQDYLDTIAEIEESNVIYGVQFGKPKAL